MIQTKYKNHSQFIIGIGRGISHMGDLSKGERLALHVLKDNADYKTAESHPGNAALISGIGCKTRQGANFIMNRLEKERKLIKKVSNGDGGRGLATVYRILVEDPRFPEPGEKPASNPKPASNKPASGDTGNLQAEQPKPASDCAETCKSELAHIPYFHPINPSSFHPETGMEGFLSDKITSMGVPTDYERAGLEKLAGEHSLLVVQEAHRRFEGRPRGLGGLTKISPWKLFLNESAEWITEVKNDKWFATPEQKAKTEALVLKLAREATERMKNRGPIRSEVSPEDFLNED